MDVTEAGPIGQVEIAYVPAAQRQQANIIDDSIVVVGQARQKKRKRVKGSVAKDGDSVADDKQKRREEVAPLEPFDYSTAPNILDDIPTPDQDPASRKKKKQKHTKGRSRALLSPSTGYSPVFFDLGAVLEYGNFPAPPKAHRELKSGNQSYTFK